jgi:hypothetical protein
LLEKEVHGDYWRRKIVVSVGGGGAWCLLEEDNGDCWRRRIVVIVGGGG